MLVQDISSREIAVSGLRAQRARMNVIAQNIANGLTTRTPQGGAFRRQMVILKGEQITKSTRPENFGVQIKKVVSDPSPFRQVFDPGHPDANADGIVNYPNVNPAVEMVNLIAAQRAYEANVAVLTSGSRINQRALEIIQS